MTEKYTIKVNSSKKTVAMRVSGSLTPEDAENFVRDYHKSMNTIDPTTYNLEFDCTTMKVVSREMVPMLEDCYKLYKESGFNKVIFQIKENAMLSMQLKRLARNTGLTNVEVVNV